MIPIKRNMTPKEQKRFRMEKYKNEKESLIAFFHEQKYDEKHLNEFLINSLKRNFEKELKEDGLL